MADDRQALGRGAEAIAAAFLARAGLEIVDRNHRTPRGEVDLVCREAGLLVFVEVRARSSDALGDPAETVDRRKARRVTAAAADWALAHGGLEQSARFDVVSVVVEPGAPPRVTHYRDAFDADGGPGLP